jgi:glycosidase
MNQWAQNPVIYEINTRIWIRELSHKYAMNITLENIPGVEWDYLAGLNIHAVWLMGVWQRSPAGLTIALQHPGNLSDFNNTLPDFNPADADGSPYCVRSYTADKCFGGDRGLRIARDELAVRGLKLILDLVPNHLAPDHPWISKYPEFFIRGNAEDFEKDPVTFCRLNDGIFACGKDPYFPAWQDVIQVNAFHPGYRDAITETLYEFARLCDGVRCDMAMLMTNEVFQKTWGTRAGAFPDYDFWDQVIRAVKARYPDFLFIAEVYWEMEWALQQQGFDFCYDKRLYDRLIDSNAQGILEHLKADLSYQEHLIRFIENHDESRSATVFSGEKEKAAAIACLTLPGARLLYEGQLEGRKIKLPVFLVRRPFEDADPKLRDFYKRLLTILSNPVFSTGSWQLCECYGWPDNQNCQHLLAWQWKGETDCFLVVINYRDQESQGMIRFYPDCHDVTEWYFDDLFTGSRYVRSREELYAQGLYAGLPGWGFHFFRVSAG